jgi:phosphatidylinositol dimannoside acyltransferase
MASRVRRPFRQRLTYRTYTGLALCLRRLPEPVARFAAASVALAMMHGHGVTVRMRADHMRRVLRDMTGEEPEPAVLKRMTRRAFLAYARYWVDGARLPVTSKEFVETRMRWEGREHLAKGMAAGAGVIMALPHVGSWEWGGSWLDSIGYPMTAVAEVLEPPELFEWFIGQRRAMGLTILPLDNDASANIARVLREGKLVGLLCDRDLVGNGIEVEFFGEVTTFPGGPAMLALRTGAMLITTAVFNPAYDDHFAIISAPIDTARTGSFRTDVTRITQEIARHFEDYIRRAPEQWHNFQPNWPSDRAGELARQRR